MGKINLLHNQMQVIISGSLSSVGLDKYNF